MSGDQKPANRGGGILWLLATRLSVIVFCLDLVLCTGRLHELLLWQCVFNVLKCTFFYVKVCIRIQCIQLKTIIHCCFFVSCDWFVLTEQVK